MDENWNKLRSCYQSKGVALCLGAGVSLDLGVPTWHNLLADLVKKVMPNVSMNDLVGAGYSLETIASLVQRSIGNDESFTAEVKGLLYQGFREKCLKRSFVEVVQIDNPVLASVAALCVQPSGNTFTHNTRIHSVVNFNFDDLFTQYVRDRYVETIVRVTERASKSAHPRSLISCYHPHGRLVLKPDANYGDESPDLLVFTEQGFFDFLSSAFAA